MDRSLASSGSDSLGSTHRPLTKFVGSRPTIERLLIQSDFGRSTSDRWALFIAGHTRWILLSFILVLLGAHLPLAETKEPILGAMVWYVGYFLLQPRLIARRAARNPSASDRALVRLWSALALIVGVSLLLALLAKDGGTGTLWLLYLPALSDISFHRRQRVYAMVAVVTAVVASALYFFELRSSGLSTPGLLSETVTRAIALLATSYLVHYFAHAVQLGERGAALHKQLLTGLTERLLVAADAPALWSAIRDACSKAVNATNSELYLLDGEQRQPRLMRWTEETDFARNSDPIRLKKNVHRATRLAAKAIEENRLVTRQVEGDLFEVAAPIHGHPEWGAAPLAIVVLRFRVGTSREKDAACRFLTELLNQIWPIATYASIRFNAAVHQLRLDEVYENVLDTLCSKLGFEFATISLVDADRREIRCVAARNVPDGWKEDAHHPLVPLPGEPIDIQADILWTGKTEVLTGWDDRFDRRMYAKHKHEDLVRVFLPLGGKRGIGTIEAGIQKGTHTVLTESLVRVLERYAHVDVTTAIQNALLHERAQRHAAALTDLHAHLTDLHGLVDELSPQPFQEGEPGRLRQIVAAARRIFAADLALLYPVATRDGWDLSDWKFASPIRDGVLRGESPLQPPIGPQNIVHHIAANGSYFRPDAQKDLLLAGEGEHSSFTTMQRICSFAGVRLVAGGEVLGVLCLNYRSRRQLSPEEEQLIELFSQQAAAMIADFRVVRAREREQVQWDLHDSVKASVQGANKFIGIALDSIPMKEELEEVRRALAAATNAGDEAASWEGVLDDVDVVRSCLRISRHANDSVLASIKLVLSNLTPHDDPAKPLRDLLRTDLIQFVEKAEVEGVHLSYTVDEDLPALPLHLAVSVSCLVNHAIENALQYADASSICVGIGCVDDELRLRIADDGQGFEPEAERGEEHRGLTIMAKRVKAVGGTLRVTSFRKDGASNEQGTTVSVVIPLKEDSDEDDCEVTDDAA